MARENSKRVKVSYGGRVDVLPDPKRRPDVFVVEETIQFSNGTVRTRIHHMGTQKECDSYAAKLVKARQAMFRKKPEP